MTAEQANDKMTALQTQLQCEYEFLQSLDAGKVTGICLLEAMREANTNKIGEIRSWHEAEVKRILGRMARIQRRLK